MADLAAVENQIAQREADLESLEAQQRTFGAQTAEATITVNLVATPAVAPCRAAGQEGSRRRLRSRFARRLACIHQVGQRNRPGLGALLPFVIVLALLGIAWLYIGDA